MSIDTKLIDTKEFRKELCLSVVLQYNKFYEDAYTSEILQACTMLDTCFKSLEHFESM